MVNIILVQTLKLKFPEIQSLLGEPFDEDIFDVEPHGKT